MKPGNGENAELHIAFANMLDRIGSATMHEQEMKDSHARTAYIFCRPF